MTTIFVQDNKGSGSQQVALQVGGDGKVRYDAIVKQGANSSRTVFSRYEDMVEKVSCDERENWMVWCVNHLRLMSGPGFR